MPRKKKPAAENARSQQLIKHDNRQHREIVERDCQRMLQWLIEAPLRTMTGPELIRWTAEQVPPWTPGYVAHIRTKVGDLMSARTEQTAQTARSRILGAIDSLLPEARELVTFKSCNLENPSPMDPRAPEFRTWKRLQTKKKIWQVYTESRMQCLSLGIKEPVPPFPEPWGEKEDIALQAAEEACPLMHTINHGAALGYLKLTGELTGAIQRERDRPPPSSGEFDSLSDEELTHKIEVAKAREVKEYQVKNEHAGPAE